MFIRNESFKQFIHYYPVISIIVGINIILYLFTTLPIFPRLWLLEQLSGVNLSIMEGELWRLVTPIFIHNGFSHILFNSFSLILFGPELERLIRPFRFTLVYLATGISANVATLFLEPLTYTHVGASGAIFGLFGFYMSIIAFRKYAFSKENSQLLITITVISIIMTFLQPNINIIGHLFGFLSGFLIGYVAFRYKKSIV